MLILSAQLANTTNRKRCGVIPYTVVNNIVYFLCAIDTKTGDYCDFGGGVKRTETAIEGGIREFREESISIFEEDVYSANTYINTAAIDDDRREMSIIFLPLQSEWFDTCGKLFNEAKKRSKEPLEVSDVEWLKEDEFYEIAFSRSTSSASYTLKRCKKRTMWLRLKSFFATTVRSKVEYGEFVELLYRVFMHRYHLSSDERGDESRSR